MSFGFSDEEREIFSYQKDDQTEGLADPMKIQRRLMQAVRKAAVSLSDIHTILGHEEKELGLDASETDITMAEVRAVQREQAIEDLLEVVHFAFETHPLQDDGTGLTEAQALKNYRMYVEFFTKKNVNTEPSLDSSLTFDAGHEVETCPTTHSMV